MRFMLHFAKYSASNALVFCLLLTQASLLAEEKTVASFEKEECVKAWTSVNDGVMGGVSKGGFTRSDQGTLIFRGELSLENNGGFASIRMKEAELDLSGSKTLVVKAKGDGRTYWIDLRAKDQMAASSYRGYLPTTAGEWKELRVPLSDFKLQAFGRELPLKPLDASSIASVGFTLADKKAGAFELEIASVKASTDEEAAAEGAGGKTIVDVAAAAGGFKTLLAAAKAAGLAEVLAGEGPFTVFAPTDEAFAKLPAGTVDTLLKPENRAQLVEVLKHHVIAGRVPLAKALEVREAPTLQGGKVAVRFEEGRVKVGSASLVKADIAASNGIIHVIDQVLIPAKAVAEPLSPSGLIELSIDKAVPLFNSGEVAGCAALYEVTCEALRSNASLPEGFRKELASSLNEARAEESARKRAWILRGALDRAWAALNEGKK